jgi:hypothetical protein
MRRHGIARAFGFDRHFVHAGFELWPEGWSPLRISPPAEEGARR